MGYSLGLAASVLYLGAIGDRYGRKLMLLLGMALSSPRLPAGAVYGTVGTGSPSWRGSLGGLASAGMASSDDAGADHRGSIVRTG